MPAGSPPGPARDETQPAGALDRLDGVERSDQASFAVRVRRPNAGERQHLTRLVRAHIDDAPALSSDANEIPRLDVALRWRYLHRVSAARVQLLPRACRRGTLFQAIPLNGAVRTREGWQEAGLRTRAGALRSFPAAVVVLADFVELRKERREAALLRVEEAPLVLYGQWLFLSLFLARRRLLGIGLA